MATGRMKFRKERGMTRRRLAFLAAAAIAVALAAGFGGVAKTSAQSGAGPTAIKMGIEPWIGYGPWWIVIAKGYDRKYGVQIKPSTFTTDADINSAFAAHRIDAENLATHTGIRFLGSGVNLKFALFEDVALRQGNGFHLIYTPGRRPGIISDLLAVNPDFAKAHPAAMVGALRAWGDAMKFYRSHTAQAQAIIAKKIGAKPADLKESFQGVQLYDLKQSLKFMQRQWLPLAKEVTAILKTQGELKSQPNVKAATASSYVKKAAAAS